MGRVRDPIYGTIEMNVAESTTETFVIPGSGQYTSLGLSLSKGVPAANVTYTLKGVLPGAAIVGGTLLDPTAVMVQNDAVDLTLTGIPNAGTFAINLGIPMGNDLVLEARVAAGNDLVITASFVLYGHSQRTSTGRA